MPGGISARPSSPSKRPGASKTRSPSRSSSSPSRSRGRSKKPSDGGLLTLDTRLDIIGVVLIIVALVSVISFFSSEPGYVTRAWLRLLTKTFGWGAYVVPVGIGAIGVWLLWRHFGDDLPLLDPIRVAGVVILFIGLLTFTHSVTALIRPIGEVYVNPALADPNSPNYVEGQMWAEAIACPVRPSAYIEQGWVTTQAHWGSYDIARCGHGGGYIGAFIQVTLTDLIGGPSVFIIALTVIFAGALMATRKSLKDVLDFSATTVKNARDRYQERRAEREQAAEDATAGEKSPAKPPQVTGRPSIVTGRGPAGSEAASPAAASSATSSRAAPASSTGAATATGAAAGAAAATLSSRPGSPSGASRPSESATQRPAAAQSAPSPTGDRQAATQGKLNLPGMPSRTASASAGASRPPSAGSSRPGAPPSTGGRSTEGSSESSTPRPSSAPPGVSRPRPGAPSASGSSRLPSLSGEDEDDSSTASRPAARLPGAPAGASTAGSPSRSTPAVTGAERRINLDDKAKPDDDQPQRPAARQSISPPTGVRPGQSRNKPPSPIRPGVRTGPVSARPVPKPDTSAAESTSGDSDDDDVVFDDISSTADDLSDAINLDDVEEQSAGKDEEAQDSAGALSAPDAESKPKPTRPPVPPTGVRAGERRPSSNPGSSAAASPMAKRTASAQSAPAASPPASRKASGGKRRKSTPSWKRPALDEMLNSATRKGVTDEELRARAEVIEQTLSSFGAPGRVVEVNHGPVITQFGVEPDYVDGRAGKRIKVKVGKISSLSDDLALALAAPTVRIEAPVPGKGYVGIEVPNAEASNVGLRDVMDTPEFRNLKTTLKLALGQDVSGQPVVADMTAMPHMLIAGTTGSGKSVCVNGIITTMLMTCTPDELKLIMVDPKRVELTNYNGIPHLMTPVVTELERIVGVLRWVQREMDERYRSFAMAGARNIIDYNTRIDKGQIDGDRLPYIMVIVDELADLMMLAPDETERVITRLAQMARATGIHIIISTQRPSVDVVTGLIKANFPARIAFAVATGVDSRVILDMPGAEKLLGRGDMLFQAPDAPMPTRMQGVFVSDEEIQRITDFWREQAEDLPPSRLNALAGSGTASNSRPIFSSDDNGDEDDDEDDMYGEAVELVREMGKASISMLQRHLRIGYTRAARLIDLMEEREIVGPHEGGSLPRDVLGPDGEPIDDDE